VSVLFFDLDNTLYPQSLGVVARIDQRINEYLRLRLGVAADEVDAVRRRFWAEHGTTLRGLMVRHAVDAADYLSFVHDVELDDLLRPEPALRPMLARLPGRKAVFTNASRVHASRVLAALGLEGAFEVVIALEDLGYVPKPATEAFRSALDRLGERSGERSTMIDDIPANLRGAKRAGMRTVWVTDRGEVDESIDHVVATVLELEAILAAATDA
jgi:putative hydrolase of the HAD superfamily